MSETLSVSGHDAIEELISQQYAAWRLKSGQSDLRFTTVRATAGPVSVGRIVYELAVAMDRGPLGAYSIVHPRRGRVTYGSRGQERVTRAGELCVHAQPGDSFTTEFDRLDCDFAFMAPTLLDDVARPAPGDTGPVRLTGYESISDGATRGWLAALSFVCDAGAHPDLTPLVSGNLARMLAATTLATFPSNALLDPTIEDRHDAHPPTLRRAIAFIESHPDQDLTVVDIARAAFVTPRALQLAFRRHLNTTPMAHLRDVRLDCAHRDLRNGTPDSTTVTAVAMRWGFASPSRFAALYRAAYGCTPGQTLRS
jgi:AraC-like DNA-binding protein